MKGIIASLLLAFILSGCIGYGGKQVPMTMNDGSKGFTMTQHYGPFIGTRGQAPNATVER